MKKIYTTLLLACIGLTTFAQEGNDTTYVMLNFTDNPWNYAVREITQGWAPDYSDLESPGAILEETDFSWPIAEGSSKKVKITFYPNDWIEAYKAPVFGRIAPTNDAEAAALGITTEKMNVLYTRNGCTLRFEAPTGYKFGKLVFYCFRSPNFMVGDVYEEEFEYKYNDNTFKQKLKVWTPTSPKVNPYDVQTWEGDETNIHFNYPYYNAHFVKVDIRLVSDGTSGINTISRSALSHQTITTLDGRTIKNDNLRKGIYIVDGKKVIR